MYNISLEIKNDDIDKFELFYMNAHLFVEELERLPELKIEYQKHKVENSRGFSIDLSTIVLKAIELGVFAAIYTAAIDFYDRYKNAEITINFKNGQSMTLKNLTQEQALKLIEKYSKE